MSEPSATAPPPRAATMAVIVAALGYLVDIYDLILFGVLRRASLADLGLGADAMESDGSFLLNAQMFGMLLGGIVWGVLGDRRGRLSVLFGSILMYSLANIANGFVHDVPTYAICRFIAGVGLAGELGAGIALVSELLSPERRGWGTTIVAGVGICGAVLAVLVGTVFPWRTAYFVGGGLGLVLLVLRIGVYESGMFEKLKADASVQRGNFLSIFRKWSRAKKYVATVLAAVPIWYAVGILTLFSPEIGRGMGMAEGLTGPDAEAALPVAGTAVLMCYVGLALGDFASGAASQLLRSRKKAIGIFLVLNALSIVAYFTLGRASPTALYACVFALGFANGYWAVFMMVAAEQFGTNLRATTTTTAPNFVRGSVPILTTSYLALHGGVEGMRPIAAMIVGAAVMALAFVALVGIEETYGKSLDFVET